MRSIPLPSLFSVLMVISCIGVNSSDAVAHDEVLTGIDRDRVLAAEFGKKQIFPSFVPWGEAPIPPSVEEISKGEALDRVVRSWKPCLKVRFLEDHLNLLPDNYGSDPKVIGATQKINAYLKYLPPADYCTITLPWSHWRSWAAEAGENGSGLENENSSNVQALYWEKFPHINTLLNKFIDFMEDLPLPKGTTACQLERIKTFRTEMSKPLK